MLNKYFNKQIILKDQVIYWNKKDFTKKLLITIYKFIKKNQDLIFYHLEIKIE